LKTVEGVFETPHSVFLVPDKSQLIVTDTGKEGAKRLDATTFNVIERIKLEHPGSDSIGYDAPRKRLYIVTGGKDVGMNESFLEEIDPETGKFFGSIRFDSNHVEALAVEQRGPRIYINVTDKNYMAVIDKEARKIVAAWPIKEAQQNAPVAIDEDNHRLFVFTRAPGKLVVLNTENGASIANFPAPGRIDEAVFDKANHRIYAAGGEGWIGVYEEKDPDHFVQLPNVITAKGAKTEIVIPSLNMLYLAESPGEGNTADAGILRYEVQKAKP